MTGWSKCPMGCCYHGSLLDAAANEYGDIPLCPACGGLGTVGDSPKVNALVRKIRTLRLEFCPIDLIKAGLPPPPPCVRLAVLERMKAALIRLNDLCDVPDCLAAQMVSEGHLDRLIRRCRALVREDVLGWTNAAHARALPRPELLPVMTDASAGRLREAGLALRRLTDERPSDTILWLYRARFVTYYLRDFSQTLSCLTKAVAAVPDCAQLHVERAQVLTILGRPREACFALLDASRCPDADGNEELRRQRPVLDLLLQRAPADTKENDAIPSKPRGVPSLN